MDTDTKTLALYSNPTSSLAIELSNQMREIQLEAIRQFSTNFRLALGFPFAEFAKDMMKIQANLAKSILLAINPLAISFEPTMDIQEAEIIEVVNTLSDLSISVEGRFYFQDQLINTISTNSKHGRLLKMLLINNDNYVTDEDAYETLDLVDKDKGISYIRRDMKKALGKAGLEVDLYRENERGYRLLGFSKLLN